MCFLCAVRFVYAFVTAGCENTLVRFRSRLYIETNKKTTTNPESVRQAVLWLAFTSSATVVIVAMVILQVKLEKNKYKYVCSGVCSVFGRPFRVVAKSFECISGKKTVTPCMMYGNCVLFANNDNHVNGDLASSMTPRPP